MTPMDGLLTGYLADTHTAVGLVVGRKYRSYTESDLPLVVCATAHYAKSLDQVLNAVTHHQPSVAKSVSHGSLRESLSALEQRLLPNTRPIMHCGLQSLINSSLPQSVPVVTARFDAVAAHIRSLL